ncbi:MAG TPA: hypothetical protein VH209_17620 [Steroidobacteraceae bacterium]|nr:hypothetical protein [Steroidobacteraceae bacterium]
MAEELIKKPAGAQAAGGFFTRYIISTGGQAGVSHSPVANAHVSVVLLVGITDVTGCRVPVTAELITLVFQFMLIVMSLKD